jgi:homoserine dehydrogenase
LVKDLPGVLAKIANVFAEHGVSVETVQQSVAAHHDKQVAMLSVMTHSAKEASLAAVVNSLKQNDSVEEVASVIRVEGI